MTITAEDLASRPIEGPCELVDGVIVPTAFGGIRHGLVVARLLLRVVPYVVSARLGLVTSGSTGFRVKRDPDSVRVPDLAFLSRATIRRVEACSETFFPCAPDLAIEALSPDDRWQDVEQKAREYLAAGGKVVWVVSPAAEQVYVYEPTRAGRVLGRDDELDGGEALPGFRTRVSELFSG